MKPSSNRQCRTGKTQAEGTSSRGDPGFTILELLVVLVVVALLGLLLLPAMARTKSDGRGFRCLNNNRELNRAWRMWADDNNDHLLFAFSSDGQFADRLWVIGPMDFTPNPNNWNPSNSIMQSPMWPYCGKNTNIWRCPSDKSYVNVNGVPRPRVLSYAMNDFLGPTNSPVYANYRRYLNLSDITHPSPDSLFVFTDPRCDYLGWPNFVTEMDGYSPRNTALYKLTDRPGFYHDGAAGFSYADGHGEIHRWQDLRTTPPLQTGLAIISTTPTPRNVDVAWLQDKATRPK